jgi:16S rRNA (cytosine1402-N4)-methyltransferase
VLLKEVLLHLAPEKANGLFVDATVGEGGHSFAMLSAYSGLRLIGIDADGAILEKAKARLGVFGGRVKCVNAWSQDFFASASAASNEAKGPRPDRPDRVLIDLGISMYHYNVSGRGFSFGRDEPLDMRLDTGSGLSAAQMLASLREAELADLIYNYGEERYSRRIAHAIVRERANAAVATTAALARIVEGAVPPAYRHGRIHCATRTFQALRIAVNGELERLPALLENAAGALAEGGRLGVISFHSLEDRIVKRSFKELAGTGVSAGHEDGGVFALVNKKVIMATDEETASNPASRSAKLRVIKRIQ